MPGQVRIISAIADDYLFSCAALFVVAASAIERLVRGGRSVAFVCRRLEAGGPIRGAGGTPAFPGGGAFCRWLLADAGGALPDYREKRVTDAIGERVVRG